MNEEKRELIQRIKWLLFLRVVILSFFLGATALIHFFKGGDLGIFRSLQVPLIAAYLVSISSALLLSRIKNLAAFAHTQVDFDVLLITGIILITGDLESPFPFLYNLAIANSAILLFYRGAFITAGVSSLCYGGVLLWSHYQSFGKWMSAHEPFVMGLTLNIPTFFIIAFLSGFLARRVYEAEQLLKQKQREYLDLDALKETLMEGMGNGVAITDLKGHINYFNSQARSLTSLDEQTVKGKKLSHIFPSLSFSFDGPIEPKGVVVNEIPFTDPKGRNKELRLTLAPLKDPADQPIGFVSIFEDITRQKELEEKVRLEEEMRRAREKDLSEGKNEGPRPDFRFEGIVGKGGGVDKIYQLVQKVAATDTNVLITGDSGTGKELVARAIHFNGSRKDGPFVAVNCGAIPENLIESELFGHVRGAFTGAVSDRDGLFKQADGGSIFLDEVGELPLHLQVKLLRVLQEKSFTPVGGSKQIKVDVRVISATNKELRKEVEKGRFREDLFYRLNVVQISMPPLRSRRDDIPALTHYFIRKFAGSHKKDVGEIASDALRYLMNYNFPGNIRELENIIEHAVAVTNNSTITEADLPGHVKGVSLSEESDLFEKTAPGGADAFFTRGMSLDDELATHEKCLLLGALKRSKGVQKKAAELLGINYRSFRHRLEKYGLLNTKSESVEGQGSPE
ncbi:MAG TPA: sigma 54-interacting transcriptional regulator [Candidatus Binatia bacterium]|nr:sigma 54-interacting transcriptional regulator [Candidatus Binatia bacterium]